MFRKWNMPTENLKKIFKRAQKEGWAIGQFNVSTLEALKAVVLAAQNLKSPVIIGTSEGESKFMGLKQAVGLVKVFREETRLPLILNLDHGRSLEYIKEAVGTGYDAVHFDGSKLPLDENIKIAKLITREAHKKGALVEGEISFIKGASKMLQEAPEIREGDLTDPKEAEEFVKKTGIDSLAINIGTFHGVEMKGDEFTAKHINFKRLEEIKKRVGNKVFLVLHGGSGVPAEEIKEAVRSGIIKININTELRIAYSRTLRKVLAENQQEIVPYNIMPDVVAAIQKVVEEKIKLFGSYQKI